MHEREKAAIESPRFRMKRYLPFLLILVVALITAGAGLMLYRAKVAAHPRLTASAASRLDSHDSANLHTLGPADAPATLEIYADFQCPPCAIASPAIDRLHHDYGTRLRVVYREFPLEIHAHSIPAAMAAEAAGEQGYFWEMHDLLYRGQERGVKFLSQAGSSAHMPRHLGWTWSDSIAMRRRLK